jgi:hypothetical protein
MMKKIILLAVLLVLLQFSCSNTKPQDKSKEVATVTLQNQNTLKRYAVKSGIVKYKITTNGKVFGSTIKGSGTESLYFKNWGAVELLEEESTKTTHSKIFGKEKTETTSTHTMSKLDNGKSYHVDFDNATVYLRRDPAMEFMKQTDTDAGDAGKKMLEAMGGKMTGKESFLGYTCEIWDVMGAKQWIYKGVTLKIETAIMGITTIKEAISAKFNSTVSASYFQLPEFPIVKEAGYLNDTDYAKEQEATQAQINKMKNMTYAAYKAMVIKEDEEAKDMSEEEFKQSYEMFKAMLKKMEKK